MHVNILYNKTLIQLMTQIYVQTPSELFTM